MRKQEKFATPSSCLIQAEDHRDGRDDFDALAIEYGRLVDPLPDRVERGFAKQRMAADYVQLADMTVASNHGAQLHGPFDVRRFGDRWVDGLDQVDQAGGVEAADAN